MALSHISLKSACRPKSVQTGVREHFNTLKKKIHIQHPNCPYLELCDCVVLIVSNLVFHGAEVHRMFDDH